MYMDFKNKPTSIRTYLPPKSREIAASCIISWLVWVASAMGGLCGLFLDVIMNTATS